MKQETHPYSITMLDRVRHDYLEIGLVRRSNLDTGGVVRRPKDKLTLMTSQCQFLTSRKVAAALGTSCTT